MKPLFACVHRPQDRRTRQKYLAAAGDCAVCHTAPNGKSYGRRPRGEEPVRRHPFLSNITPDKKYGIGDYSQAVREGAPARTAPTSLPGDALPLPYDKISDAEITALYAYFMEGVDPIAEAASKTVFVWPFSMRWGGTGVGLGVRAPKEVSAFAAADDLVGHDRYLVESLGHCGSWPIPTTSRSPNISNRCPHEATTAPRPTWRKSERRSARSILQPRPTRNRKTAGPHIRSHLRLQPRRLGSGGDT